MPPKKKLDAFGYSKFDGLGSDSSDEETLVPPDISKTDPAYRARLTWQNTKTEALVQVMMPPSITANGVRVYFDVRQTVIEYGYRTGVQSMKLPHPAVIPRRCRWSLGKRHFDGYEGEQPSADLHFVKVIEELWRTDTFEVGGQRRNEAPMKEPDEGYTFEQDGDKVSFWFSVNPGITSKDVIVHPKADVLHVDFFRDASDRHPSASIMKHLRGPVKPDETIWMFDDIPERGRSIRIDMVLVDDADWAAGGGPFQDPKPTKAAIDDGDATTISNTTPSSDTVVSPDDDDDDAK